MVQMLVEELTALGFDLQPRNQAGAGHWRREAEQEKQIPCV
jgi:hypothetical protein